MISNSLLGCKYTDIKILLEKARSIEEIKKDIIDNFSKQEKFFTSKFSSQKSSKRSGTGSGFATLTGGFASTRRSTKSLARTGTSSLGNCTHLNSRFGLMSKKPEGWVRPWYKPQSFPKKLINDEQIVMAREKRCWSYHESGHRISDNCCFNKLKIFNTAKVEEVENSRSEKKENT